MLTNQQITDLSDDLREHLNMDQALVAVGTFLRTGNVTAWAEFNMAISRYWKARFGESIPVFKVPKMEEHKTAGEFPSLVLTDMDGDELKMTRAGSIPGLVFDCERVILRVDQLEDLVGYLNAAIARLKK